MDPVTILVFIAVIAGLYLAFNIGANDVANAMGTSVGSGALTIRKAIVSAAIFEFLGAFIIGDEVSRTIKNGFVGPEIFASDPTAFAYGMTASILATALFLQYATHKGLPVSTTQGIVGAVLGFALVNGGIFEINFPQLLAIFSSWLIAPVLGGMISFVSLKVILKFIIDTDDPLYQAKKLVPIMMGLAVFMLSVSFSSKIMQKFLFFEFWGAGYLLAGLMGFTAFSFFKTMLERHHAINYSRKKLLEIVETIFARMQMVTACFLAFAHGSNDVANAIGPAAGVISALTSNSVKAESYIPAWLMLIGGIGIVFGLATFGIRVIKTVGQKITEITPTRGFAAEFGASFTILGGTILGIPLSTTHVLVGAVIGVGFARGISGVNVQVVKRIARSWVITMPLTSLLSIVFCLVLKFF